MSQRGISIEFEGNKQQLTMHLDVPIFRFFNYTAQIQLTATEVTRMKLLFERWLSQHELPEVSDE